MYTCIHSSIIQDSQKVGSNLNVIREWCINEIFVYIYIHIYPHIIEYYSDVKE